MSSFQQLAEWDWVVTFRSLRLHHVAEADWDDLDREWGGPALLSCGRRSEWVMIPGIFSRMGGTRCQRCCTVVGYPQGVGSPKNDEACRHRADARATAATDRRATSDVPDS